MDEVRIKRLECGYKKDLLFSVGRTKRVLDACNDEMRWQSKLKIK